MEAATSALSCVCVCVFLCIRRRPVRFQVCLTGGDDYRRAGGKTDGQAVRQTDGRTDGRDPQMATYYGARRAPVELVGYYFNTHSGGRQRPGAQVTLSTWIESRFARNRSCKEGKEGELEVAGPSSRPEASQVCHGRQTKRSALDLSRAPISTPSAVIVVVVVVVVIGGVHFSFLLCWLDKWTEVRAAASGRLPPAT